MVREEDPLVEDEIDLKAFFLVIRRRKWTIAALTLMVFVLAMVGTLLTVPEYTATAKLLIEQSQKNPLTDYVDKARYPEFIGTQSEIITSLPVTLNVVRMLGLEARYDELIKNPETDTSIRGFIKRWVGQTKAFAKGMLFNSTAPSDGLEDQDGFKPIDKEAELAHLISEKIMIKPVKDTHVVSINFTSSNPELARQVINTMVDAYMKRINEMRLEASSATIHWMSTKADEERKKLEKSEKLLQSYMRQSDIVTVEDRIAIIPQKISEISRASTAAETHRHDIETLLRSLRRVQHDLKAAETIPFIAGNESVQMIRRQILEADQNVMELSNKYGPKHPKMRRIQADLKALKEKYNQEVRRVIKSVENDYALARDKEENLKALLEKTKQDAALLNEKFIQYGILKREVDSNRVLYDALVKKIKEQSVSEEAQTVDVWVVESAKKPEIPSNRRLKKNMVLSLILGLMGGMGLAFLLEYLDNTVKVAEDVERKLALPVLGSVSLLYDKDQKELAAETVVMVDAPKTNIAENYRSIRTGVMLSSSKGAPKSLLVSSSHPKDGKTTVASNLALSLAQAGKKVLLIDGDMRRPRLHEVFKLDKKVGLSSFLSGMSDLKIFQKGPIPNLMILPAGPIPPNPSELLAGDRLSELINACLSSAKFDHIIIDTPPLLHVPDGLIISRNVQHCILVLRSGTTTYAVAEKGVRALESVNANLLGIVVNGVDLRRASYYEYDYYRYGSGYGYGGEEEKGEKELKAES